MTNLAQFLDLNTLKAVPTSTHVFLENRSKYSIVLNLLGIDERDIGIHVNEKKREITVLAKKEVYNAKKGFFWVFGVPSECVLDGISTKFRGGVLEISIPKGPQHPYGFVA